jgi:predicted RNA-binding Zn-ribbon protein involved in translation (DUF1610 family)
MSDNKNESKELDTIITLEEKNNENEKKTIENSEKKNTETEEVDNLDIEEPEEKSEKYTCECIECGHKLETDKHCKDINCPECGGQMRREERPGPGQSRNENSKYVSIKKGQILETSDFKKKKEEFELTGKVPKAINVKLAFAHVGTNLNLFTFTPEELSKAMPTVSGVAGKGIPIQWGHDTSDPRSTVGWTYDQEFDGNTAFANAKITNPEAIQMILRDELRFCSMGCYLIPICSICGRDISSDPKCIHIRGKEYEVEGNKILCTVVGKDIQFDHIGFTNFPADPLATVDQLAVAIASKEIDEIMKLKVNNQKRNKEDTNMSEEEILKKLDELSEKVDELVTDDEIVDVAEKVSELTLENEKLKEENETLKADNEKLKEAKESAQKELDDLAKINHEKMVSAVLEAEKKVKGDFDIDARKEELSKKSEEVLAALAEGLSHVKIEEENDDQVTTPNSETPKGDKEKSFAEMTPAERREKYDFNEIVEKLRHLNRE